MDRVRCLIRTRGIALLLVLGVALAGWAAKPAGFMPADTGTTLVLAVCNPVGASSVTITTPGDPEPADQAAKAEACPFAGFGGLATGTVPPPLLVEAIGFILARAHLPTPALPPLRRAQLRPPLRGPPLA